MGSHSGRCEPRGVPEHRDSLIGAGLTVAAALVLAAMVLLRPGPLTRTVALVMLPGVLVLGYQWAPLRRHSGIVRLVWIAGPLLVLLLIGLAVGLLTGK